MALQAVSPGKRPLFPVAVFFVSGARRRRPAANGWLQHLVCKIILFPAVHGPELP